MSSDIAIRAVSLTKGFESYEQPSHRLKRSILGLLGSLAPLPSLRRALFKRAEDCVRTFWALRGVDFEIARGETVGIIGRNGSGKSTLLQIICGTLAPTGGEVETRGRIAALLELGSGFDVEYTGRENIYMNGQLHGLSRDQIDARLERIVEFADIGHFIDQPVKTYSSGMFVRLAFAVIAHVDADILVIDEALAVGDAFFTQKCMRFLRRFQQTGTVLFVSHDSSAVRSLCSRVIWLDRGAIRETGEARHVCTSYFEAFYRQQQGEAVSWASSEDLGENNSEVETPLRVVEPVQAQTADQRQEFIDTGKPAASLRALEVDPHNLPAQRDEPLIESVQLLNEQGSPVSWVVGGERVVLRIHAKRPQSDASPVFAFFVKDRLGQPLFGDDTSLTSVNDDVALPSARTFDAEFVFNMPILPPGDYAFTALVVEQGDAAAAVRDCWHDALIVKSESTSVSTGLVGVPMSNVALFVRDAVEQA
ncbi:lipopolysaccharide transport system ATP-binding protein [Paraburkholderia phenoliruptrix]|uniref:ABC transporter ATP-binding protein n=1 Tax=Paraburkholderia phenoliruptrix TaxID=252970 RepID=UPI00286219D6|nr:ABC transporter ATP-binding protein [Paraburkholderia phenoliruptrix]MDR6423181.1 lipopolysaccharide transport system ATP-binding protein [Paraburkholderia phenoliruptrix]